MNREEMLRKDVRRIMLATDRSLTYEDSLNIYKALLGEGRDYTQGEVDSEIVVAIKDDPYTYIPNFKEILEEQRKLNIK